MVVILLVVGHASASGRSRPRPRRARRLDSARSASSDGSAPGSKLRANRVEDLFLGRLPARDRPAPGLCPLWRSGSIPAVPRSFWSSLLCSAVRPWQVAWQGARGTALRPALVWVALAIVLSLFAQVASLSEPLASGRPGAGRFTYRRGPRPAGGARLGAQRPHLREEGSGPA